MLRALATHWRRSSAAIAGAAACAALSQLDSRVSRADALTSAEANVDSSADEAPSLVRRETNGTSRIVLAGDCGGTNTRLQLFRVPMGVLPVMGQKPPGELILARKYVNSDYASFLEVAHLFLNEARRVTQGREVEACCLACAGGIKDNAVRFTNVSAGWVIDGNELQAKLGIPRVMLINDFEAQGYGLLTLQPEERLVLNDAKPVPGAPIACVGAGTGLGECFLTAHHASDNKASGGGAAAFEYRCWPSEGGHAEFSPRDEISYDLLTFLKSKYTANHRVSVERVVSGPGLSNVYEFLRQHWAYRDRVSVSVDAQWLNAPPHLKGAAVAGGAEAGDVLCLKAVAIFSDAYGSEAGTAALKWLPYGGLYISGGIAAKNPGWVQSAEFRKAFFDKGRMTPLLELIPLFVVLVEDTGERGAMFKAMMMLEQEPAPNATIAQQVEADLGVLQVEWD